MKPSTSPQRIVLYGLGNPGLQYARTRHNVGQWALDDLAEDLGFEWSKTKLAPVMLAQGKVGDHHLMLVKSLGYMNLSGQSIRPLLTFYQIPIDQVWVLHDELEFAPGMVKYKHKGGAGGHNGLRNLIQCCGDGFHRLRMGIGRPLVGEVSPFVLGKPSPDELDKIHGACDRLVRLLPQLVSAEQKDRWVTTLHEHNKGNNGS